MNEKMSREETIDPIVLSTDQDIVDYIERLTDTMVLMAAGRDMSTLRYFLDMVRAEAAELRKLYEQQ